MSSRLRSGELVKKPAKKAKLSRVSVKRKGDVERDPGQMLYWLFKSEPESRIQDGHEMKFGIDDLAECDDQTCYWDGVRNYQARNYMKQMKSGDLGFFYHSNCKPPGVVGVVQVVKESYPDFTAWDENDPHFDPKSTKDSPRWFMCDIKLIRKFDRMIPLKELKDIYNQDQSPLANMVLLNQGRVSVQPVSEEEWNYILKLE